MIFRKIFLLIVSLLLPVAVCPHFLVFRQVGEKRVAPTSDEFRRAHEILVRYQFPMYVYDANIAAEEKDLLDANEVGFLQQKIQHDVASDLQVEAVPPTIYALGALFLDLQACAVREILVRLENLRIVRMAEPVEGDGHSSRLEIVEIDYVRRLLGLPFFTRTVTKNFEKVFNAGDYAGMLAWRQKFEDEHARLIEVRAACRGFWIDHPDAIHVLNSFFVFDQVINELLIKARCTQPYLIDSCVCALCIGPGLLHSCLFADRIDASVFIRPAGLIRAIEFERRYFRDACVYFYMDSADAGVRNVAEQRDRLEALDGRCYARRIDRAGYRRSRAADAARRLLSPMTVAADILAGLEGFHTNFLSANMLPTTALSTTREYAYALYYQQAHAAHTQRYSALCERSSFSMQHKIHTELTKAELRLVLWPLTLLQRNVSSTILALCEQSTHILGVREVPYVFYAAARFAGAAALYIPMGSYGRALVEEALCPALSSELVADFVRRGVIIVDEGFDQFSYVEKKVTLLHEVAHALQVQERGRCCAINQRLYPRGIEQEADSLAILNCRCRRCAGEAALLRASGDVVPEGGYLTAAEVRALAERIPTDELCDYHRAAEAAGDDDIFEK